MGIKDEIRKAREKIIGNREEREREGQDVESRSEKEIYDELKKLIMKLPSIGGTLLTTLAEKGINLPKIFIQITSTIIREELRSFLNSIDVVGLAKKVLLDTAIELKIEVAFKDKRKEEAKEEIKSKKKRPTKRR